MHISSHGTSCGFHHSFARYNTNALILKKIHYFKFLKGLNKVYLFDFDLLARLVRKIILLFDNWLINNWCYQSTMWRVDYALVNNPNHLGLLFLVEISNYASTRLEDLDFIRNLLIHPHLQVCKLLKLLKHLSITSEDERKMILIELINTSNKKFNTKYNEEDCIMLALDKMMEYKVEAITYLKSDKMQARTNTAKYELILKLLH